MRITVTAERGNGVWVLESDNGAVSQVRSLAQAADEMREAVAYLAGVTEDDIEIDVVPILPTQFTEAQQRAERLRTESARLQHEAAQASHEAARTLVGAGLSMRDAAIVMGVSHQRIAQLARA